MDEIVNALVQSKEVTYPVMAFIVTGLVQALKKSFPVLKPHAELIAPLLGLLLGLLVGLHQNDFLTHGLLGVVAGLAGSGIFDITKKEKKVKQ